MFIVAKHRISDPERFWEAVRTAMAGPQPEGVRLHGTYPNQGGTEAVCLWEADSADTVRDAVERVTGDASRNEFFEVDPTNAVGLPGTTMR